MNWDKAKNIIIVFLLLLNILLGAMVYRERDRYSLSQESRDAIYTVLFQNKIGLYTQMIKKCEPMRQLDMQQYDYDLDAFGEIFFTGEGSVKRTVELNKPVWKRGEEILTLQNGYIIYENPNGTEPIFLNEESATALCESFLQKWGKEFKDFEKDSVVKNHDRWIIDYCQNYRGTKIYSNFFTFTVTEKGIERIHASFSRPLGYKGNSREIYFSDEVLFTLVYELRNMYGGGDKGLIINQMDLVYFQEESGTSPESALKATPYYRFYIAGEDRPFLINAYTNTYTMASR